MRLFCGILAVLLCAPGLAHAQVGEEFQRQVLIRELDAIQTSLLAGDVAGASSRAQSLSTTMVGRQFPSEEVRREVTYTAFTLKSGDFSGARSQVASFRSRVATQPTEISRLVAAADMKLLEVALNTTATSVPPSALGTMANLGAHLEPFPSFYRAWVMGHLNNSYTLASLRQIPAARTEFGIMIRGVGASVELEVWRAGITAAFAGEDPDPAVVLAAVNAFPTAEVIPAASPFEHWQTVHLPVIRSALERAVLALPAPPDPPSPLRKALVKEARTEWQKLLDNEREF